MRLIAMTQYGTFASTDFNLKIEYPPCNSSAHVILTAPSTTRQYTYYLGDVVSEIELGSFEIWSDTGYCDHTDIGYAVTIPDSSIISVPASFTATSEEPAKFEWSSSDSSHIN
jgi:hypothetical protein